MQPGFVRIIAGKWRGRRLKILDVKGLRPTPDRVRETLFNWLSPHLKGARCLDLFAGSGALGFEALSRGALYVEMVDEALDVIKLLKEELFLFGVENSQVYQASIPREWPPFTEPFDIIFLDPPYYQDLLIPCCHFLEKQGYLRESGIIYLEAQQLIKDNDLPKNWRIYKSHRAGQVFYHLAHRV